MSQLVKTKRQANFKDFKRFGAFKGLVEQKTGLFMALVAHSWHKDPNLHTNSLNILLYLILQPFYFAYFLLLIIIIFDGS
jgi:hypothetical protein